MTPDNLRDVLAEAFGEHTPVYDYRNGHFTMECEACDFTLYGIDREDAKRRFGEHFANLATPTVARLIADARADQAAADRERLGRLADEWGHEPGCDPTWGNCCRTEQLRAALDSEGGA